MSCPGLVAASYRLSAGAAAEWWLAHKENHEAAARSDDRKATCAAVIYCTVLQNMYCAHRGMCYTCFALT